MAGVKSNSVVVEKVKGDKKEKSDKKEKEDKQDKKDKTDKKDQTASKEAKHVIDTREAAGLSGRALKARVCFNWQRKGRCPKGDACPKLHAGEPTENRAKHVEKVVEKKAQAKPAADGKKRKKPATTAQSADVARAELSDGKKRKKYSHPPDWICPKCENTNWGRREVCNGRTCGTPRPDAGARSGTGPALPAGTAGGHRTSQDNSE
jgi:hypothetical protein